MTITKSNRDALLSRLTRFAGDSTILEDALEELSATGNPPTLDQILSKILEIRHERNLGMPTANDAPFAALAKSLISQKAGK